MLDGYVMMMMMMMMISSCGCHSSRSSSEMYQPDWTFGCRVVKPLVPIVRPKGLGLGADKSVLQQTSNNKSKHHSSSVQEDELVLKRGSHCMLIGGQHDGQYGNVRLI